MFTSFIKSFAMNLIFGDIYSKSKYFPFLALIAKYMYKYLKSNIFYELSNVKVLTYSYFKKFHEDMSSKENEMYMTNGLTVFIAVTVHL